MRSIKKRGIIKPRRNESPILTNNYCTYDGDLIICNTYICKKSLRKKYIKVQMQKFTLQMCIKIHILNKISS